jgi:small subunit ribosomal protein S5
MAKHGESQKKEKTETEFIEKVLYVNRCSKVAKGGRRFSFSALIVVGNKKGKVGCGFAKANELTDAIRKGGESAHKNLIQCPMEGTTIPHEITVHWDGATVFLKPAPPGTGVIAAPKIRAILELAGIKDVMAKNLGANNPINQVKAVIEAILRLSTREEIKRQRGLVE